MGLFDAFGKKFEDQVQEAIASVAATTPGVSGLSAEVRGKVITLKGKADSREVRDQVMQKIDQAVKADNIVNAIEVAKPPAPAAQPAGPAATERFYEVVAGDTLGKIAQKYYGKASSYVKIFEANRDILSNPDLIKPGQKLRIPE
ncbi:MAG: LysM peptidoglycan-binding domain-containing protein [Thermoanaerobaculales bacterium]|jgi:nucleoid-associated protein YgaU|nr:LysM peptidoglycan-binding domain-containing protein [Thermoanaerobaculales bacterium]